MTKTILPFLLLFTVNAFANTNALDCGPKTYQEDSFSVLIVADNASNDPWEGRVRVTVTEGFPGGALHRIQNEKAKAVTTSEGTEIKNKNLHAKLRVSGNQITLNLTARDFRNEEFAVSNLICRPTLQ